MSSPEFIPDPDPAPDAPQPGPRDEPTPADPNRAAKPRPPLGARHVPRRQTAGILGIVAGFLGGHHFYLGSWGAGVALLAASCCGVGMVVGVVEGVMLLAMSDDEFQQKYVQRSPEPLEFVFQERP